MSSNNAHVQDLNEYAQDRKGVKDRRGSVLLSFLIPVYNEQETIKLFLECVDAELAGVHDLSVEYVFVNDGSRDDTWMILVELQRHRSDIVAIDLTRNFGKEAAMSAGLEVVAGDVIVPIDVDLQDPPDLVPAMLSAWREGADVVLARRADRSKDAWLKRKSANWFYRFHNLVASPKIPENVGDFRLMDRAVVDALKLLPESRRFMKGLFAWVGYPTVVLDYTREERVAGESKFNTWKLWNFALEGITSFSTAPLRIWTYLGIAVSAFCFFLAVVLAIRVLAFGADVPGYASIMVAIVMMGGLQMIGIGMLGEYIGRTYLESKRRPVYLIREVLGKSRESHK